MTNDKSKLSKKEKDKAIEKIMDENAEQYNKFISSPFVHQYDEKGNRVIYCVPPSGIIRTLMNADEEYYPEEYYPQYGYSVAEKVISDYLLTHCGVDTSFHALKAILMKEPALFGCEPIIDEILSNSYVFKDKRIGLSNGSIVMDIGSDDVKQTQLAFRKMGLYDE